MANREELKRVLTWIVIGVALILGFAVLSAFIMIQFI